ncbi:hypothetical protein [Cupriavidus campinensis]|uniref:Uncharacterized protein n=1 Tax=Cupriavidus campinensis TaxID=151783 RepID=A0AAE9I3A0_9BURK|nr:hypothetical protein [Cupriavidus campinensis]URF05272.1 hypothetical protein M5D45_05475 [Cupriavidus campinensis]
MHPKDFQAQQNPITQAFEDASRAMGFHERIAPGFTEGRLIPQPAVASTRIDLSRAMTIGATVDGVYALQEVPAGESQRLDAFVAENSRVAQAGARVIVATPKPKAAPELGMYQSQALVRAINPATFAAVEDGANAAASALPFADVTFGWEDAPSVAFNVTVSRAQQRAVGGGAQLEADLLHAILLGLAEAADRTLLAAIVTSSPAAFSLGAAAARHLKFSDLRAIIGTSGTGATVRQDGALAVQGIAAELSAATASTIVGAFGRSAVAVRPEVDLHVKRVNANGDFTATVFASLIGLVPDASSFWTVSA